MDEMNTTEGCACLQVKKQGNTVVVFVEQGFKNRPFTCKASDFQKRQRMNDV